MKVVLSGLYYPVAIVRYFQHALLHYPDVKLFTVGPYTGDQIPWGNGMFVKCPLPKPDLALPVGYVSISAIESQLPWKPDVWLHVDAAYSLSGRPQNGTKYLIVGTDPHCVDYDPARRIADKFFCMQQPYMKSGDVWLPYAYDPLYHHHDPSIVKEYDVVFVGADGRQGPLYEPRDKLMGALRNKGFKVLQKFGAVYDDACKIWNSGRVGINWSTRLDTTARVFEVMACRTCLATNFTPDMDALGFVHGKDYVGFKSLDEALELIEYALVSETPLAGNEWESISDSGWAVVAGQTWSARVRQVLDYA